MGAWYDNPLNEPPHRPYEGRLINGPACLYGPLSFPLVVAGVPVFRVVRQVA